MENKTGEQTGTAGKKARSSFLPALLFLLCLGFAVTSGMVGFLLGRNASGSTGELIDTIVLSPGDSGAGLPAAHFLSGKVLYADGAPCGDVTVRMKESGLTDRTDSQGKFYFSRVSGGQHTLEVLDSAGSALASAPVSLEFARDGQASADTSGTPYTFRLPEDARMLELTLTVEEDRTLTVKEGTSYFVTGNGDIADFSGSMLSVSESTYAVTPAGNVVSPGGYVMVPTRETIFTPQGQIEELPQQAADGVQLKEDGSAETPGGVVVLPDSSVSPPEGGVVESEDKIILIDQEKAEEVETLPEPYDPSPPQDAPPEGAGGEPPQASEDMPAESGMSEPPENAPPEDGGNSEREPEESEAPEPTEPPMDFSMSDDQGGVSWSQQSMVDLFKNRTSGKGLGEENGVPVIAPGSAGFYEFQLKNAEEYDIDYNIAIEERSFHLPILYCIVDCRTGKRYLYGGKLGKDSGISTPVIRIPANSQQNYRLEWEWQYEDEYTASEDDAYDLAATQGDRVYILSVAIAAEQVIPKPVDPVDDETRYPGKR